MTRATLTRWLIFLALLAATLLGLVVLPGLDVERWVNEEKTLREWVAQHQLLAWSLAAAVYTLATALSLPVAAVLSCFLGWLFGFWPALVIVSFSSTAGATGAFLTSRYLVGDWVQRRYAARLAGLNAAIERDGAAYLFLLRLIPYVPFFLVTLGMGLT
ncbi:MAG: TVP38/TMEM64 family protein, partial [Planctomycetota bacterium]